MDTERAINVFVQAFCAGKSQTYPYVPSKIEGLWVMRDHPPRKKCRKMEVIAHGQDPEAVVAIVKGADLDWHFLCHIHESHEDYDRIRNEYKTLGYRPVTTEWLFVHDLRSVPLSESNPPVTEIFSQEELDLVPQVASQKRKFCVNQRLFGCWNEETDIGWVRSIPVGQDAWVSALHVHNIYRRQGFGMALMSKLLTRDLETGCEYSVLLATAAGSKLYPRLGYQEIATLQMFCPIHR